MKFFKFLLIFLFLAIGGFVFVGVYLAEGIVHLPRRKIRSEAQKTAESLAAEFGASLTNVSLTKNRNTLRAWSFHLDQPAGKVVFLLHGQGDNRAGMLTYARVFLRNGYSVLIPDSRGHGESDGHLSTYGITESDDIAHWRRWLMQHWKPSCIYGFGESMGAAILLQSLKTSGFCAVAAESPFSSFVSIARDRLVSFLPFPEWINQIAAWPVTASGFAYLNLRYRIDMYQASPIEVISQTDVPILLIHGMNDTSIPLSHSIDLVMRNSGIKLWKVPGAGHTGAYGADPQEFEDLVCNWFEKHQNL